MAYIDQNNNIFSTEVYKIHPKYLCSVSNKGNVIGVMGNLMVGTSSRYHRVTLKDYTTNTKHTVSVHRLVVEMFIGDMPQGMVINHIDGDKLNNNDWNLEICTQKHNAQHALDNGLTKPKVGEEHGMSILTDANVLEIYDLIKNGNDNNQIANIFGVNFRTVSLIRNGDRWKHLFDKHMGCVIPSKNTKYLIGKCLSVINDITSTDMKNIQISIKHGIEPSLISRVRSKKTWGNIWTLHNGSATTIPKGSTPQVYGGGNAKSPIC